MGRALERGGWWMELWNEVSRNEVEGWSFGTRWADGALE